MPEKSCIIYAVIVTYNGERWIKKCLTSLTLSTIQLSIVVVDNNSTDNTKNIISKEFPTVELIENIKNQGFGKANNIGISKAIQEGADFVFLLNQDAWIEPNTISHMVKVSKSNPTYGILSPIHLNGIGNAFDTNFFSFLVKGNCSNFFYDLLASGRCNVENIYDVSFVNAAAWLLPKLSINIIGGFNPLFFHYGEDRDYVNRVLYHNLKVGICPKSIIYHDRENRDDSYKNNIIKSRLNLVKWSNINTTFNEKKIGSKYKRAVLKNLFQFKFKNAKSNWKSYRFFRSKVSEIYSSRAISSTEGQSYL